MITNNPYNCPQPRPHKISCTQISTTNHRIQPSQNIPVYIHHPQIPPYPNRTNIYNNIPMKRSCIFNIEQTQNPRPSLHYPQTANQQPLFIPTPKSQHILPTNTNQVYIQNYPPNMPNTNGVMIDKKQFIDQQITKQNSGILLDSKQLNQKIQFLSKAIKDNQKRIVQLQKNNIPSLLQKYTQQQQLKQSKKQIYNYIKNQNDHNIKKLNNQILALSTQIKNCFKYHDFNNIINHQIQQSVQQKKYIWIGQIENHHKFVTQQHLDKVYKEIQHIHRTLHQKIKQNYQCFSAALQHISSKLTSLHQNINNKQKYKSSKIKCTGTAILLRYLQCFKVQKNQLSHFTQQNPQTNIVLMDNTYYVDSQGYLLDRDCYYLIDQNGIQVKLEDNHIKLLKQENIFF